MTLLEVEDIHTYYGAIEALRGVSLRVEEGEVVTIIGSNGAGKSTTLRSISGLTPAKSGRVTFEGKEITRLPAHEIVGFGIALAPEGRHCFPRMSVRENLDLGSYLRRDGEINEDLERVYQLFPRLKERERQHAGTMSGGEQQMLAIGRALMTNPDCLIMDEPSEGLAPIIIQGVWQAISRLKEEGLSILLVEQNAHLALKLVDYVLVMSKGQVVHSSTPAELSANDAIKSSYLGI
jgi:branched-chain amino acid transport system ATP-binding protein